MMTVSEVSKLTGVSVRTLHYYDEIGLLHPTFITEAGYRMYGDKDLERLQHIMMFRTLEFSLKDIKSIIDSSTFDRNKALDQQIELLTLRKEHIENLIDFARGIKLIGVKNLDFSAFDTKKLDEYAAQAKETWGKTEAYKEFEVKSKNRSTEQNNDIAKNMMILFEEFGEMRDMNPSDERVQLQVKKLKDYITEHFYNCTKEILAGLGKMYNGGGSMTENIDNAGGKGTAELASKAIEIYCK